MNNRVKKYTIHFLFISILLGLSLKSYAADHYIRDGATGVNNGSNWTDAWEDWSDIVWTRGDTYFFADGDYLSDGSNLSTPENGSEWIYLIKATTDEVRCTGVTGWVSTYGDGQARISGPQSNSDVSIPIKTGYWSFDGVVGGGPTDWAGDSTAYGFRFTGPANQVDIDNLYWIFRLGDSSAASQIDNIIFRHCQMDFSDQIMPDGEPDYPGDGNVFASAVCIFSNVSSAEQAYQAGANHVDVQYCSFQDYHMGLWLNNTDDVLIEYNYFARSFDDDGSGSRQEDAIGRYNLSNWTVRYNLFEDQSGTASVNLYCGFQGVPSCTYRTIRDISIYGNTFWRNTWTQSNDNGTIIMMSHDGTGDTVDGVYIYNNTFYNLNCVTESAGVNVDTNSFSSFDSVTNVESKNNMYISVDQLPPRDALHNDVPTVDYNFYADVRCGSSLTNEGVWLTAQETHGQHGNANILSNPSSRDFSLTQSTNSGESLSSPYNVDMFGNVRGADGVWDRGAIEYTGIPSPDPTAVISSPANGQVFTYENRTITLDASGSYDSDGRIVQWAWTDSRGDSIPSAESVSATLSAGTHQITLTVTDNDNHTDTATVTITVNEALINQSPQAANDTASLQQDSSGNVLYVLSNDTDPDGDAITISSITQPANGTAQIVNNNTQISYTHDPAYTGSDLFTYTVSDGNGATDTATVQITVNEIPESSTRALVAHWKLTENEGETALDYSANNYAGTLVNNPVWESGEGLNFSGNQYLEIDDINTLELPTPMTFSTWVKLNSFESWAKILVKPHNSFASPWEMYALDLGVNGNTPRFVVTDGVADGSAAFAASTQTIIANQWYHIVGTYDGSRIQLYLNGQLVATQAVNFPIGTNSMPLCIGGRLGSNTIDGNLSDIRIYDECLTTEQVNALYDRKRNDGLAILLDMADKSAPDFESTTAKDRSGNGQNALLLETPEWGNSWEEEDFLRFDGSNQAVEVSCEFLQAQGGTVALWVEPGTAENQRQVLFGHTNGSGNLVQLYTEDGHLGIVLGSSGEIGTTGQLVADTLLEPGVMQHVALTWNGTEYAVYLEAEQKATGTFSGLGALAATADIANVGTAAYRSQGFGFEGIVDDVQLYSRALSADEIKARYYTITVKENRMLEFFIDGGPHTGDDFDNLPSGAVFDDTTQELVWKPWYDQAGDHTVLLNLPDQQIVMLTLSVQDVKISDWYREYLRQNGEL